MTDIYVLVGIIATASLGAMLWWLSDGKDRATENALQKVGALSFAVSLGLALWWLWPPLAWAWAGVVLTLLKLITSYRPGGR